MYAVSFLLVQIFIACLLTAAAVGLAIQIAHDARIARSQAHFLDWFWPYMAIQWLMVSVLIGVWLKAGLSHWRPRLAWVVWGCLVGTLAGLAILGPSVRHLAEQFLVAEYSERAVREFLQSLFEFSVASTVVLLTLALSLVGVPMGRVLVGFSERRRSIRWRSRRAKLRRRRTS